VAKKYSGTEFSGNMEIVSLTGNVTRKDGEVYLHIHIALAREGGSVVGGHLNSARVSATAEIFVRTLPGHVGRKFDGGEKGVGLNLFEF
jgi:predicted DNA-binding protein with PD1-like motif